MNWLQLIQSVLPLLGVIIGGYISYKAQLNHQEKIEKRKDKRQKLIAYNNFLNSDGINPPLEIPMHQGMDKGFHSKIYREGTRKILYDNLHLFPKPIPEKVLKIDYYEEKAEVMGPEQQDTDNIYKLYTEIKIKIKEDYNLEIK